MRQTAWSEYKRAARRIDPSINDQEAHRAVQHVENIVLGVSVSARSLSVAKATVFPKHGLHAAAMRPVQELPAKNPAGWRC